MIYKIKCLTLNKSKKMNLGELSRVQDSAAPKKVKDSKIRRMSDSFKNMKKRIKDELEETESTDEAIEVVVAALDDPEADSKEVAQATVEVFADIIEVLQDKLEGEDEE